MMKQTLLFLSIISCIYSMPYYHGEDRNQGHSHGAHGHSQSQFPGQGGQNSFNPGNQYGQPSNLQGLQHGSYPQNNQGFGQGGFGQTHGHNSGGFGQGQGFPQNQGLGQGQGYPQNQGQGHHGSHHHGGYKSHGY